MAQRTGRGGIGVAVNQLGGCGVALALLATSAGCGSDDNGEPAPGAGGSGGTNSPDGSEEDDLENCRADLPEWTAERELAGSGALVDFTIVDGSVYYAAGTAFYSDTFPAAASGGPEELL